MAFLARRENLINIHNFVPENGRIRACAAEQRSKLTQLGPISCHKALTRRYCYYFCTTGKCIASLLAFLNGAPYSLLSLYAPLLQGAAD